LTGNEPAATDFAISVDRACLLRGGEEIRLRAKTFGAPQCAFDGQSMICSAWPLNRFAWHGQPWSTRQRCRRRSATEDLDAVEAR